MKKPKLGTIPYPERYSPAGNDCMLADSLEAYDFFTEFYPPGGVVVLGKVTLSSVIQPTALVWIYIDTKKEEVLSLLPIFKSDFENAQSDNIITFDFFEHEILFFLNSELYTSIFTSTGQIRLMKVRSIPRLNDFWEVLQLEGLHTVTDIYAVKVYSLVDNSFLATCWAFTTDKDEFYFKPICIDDNEQFDDIDIEMTEAFPVDLEETALIGGEHYILRYTKETGTYFDKVFKAEPKKFKTLKKGDKPKIIKMPKRN